MMSDSSYSSVAPNPLHVGHAPRGLLNEKSCGVGAGARVPSYGHSKRSVKRSRTPLGDASADATGPSAPGTELAGGTPVAPPSPRSTTHSPSPSANAVPTASAT